MYIRTTRRVNKDGSVVEYVQLAHNYRDPESGRPKPEILFNLGRRDQLDLDVLRRLTDSIQRFIGPADGPAAPNRSFLESRPMGGAWLLRGLWDQLEIGATLEAIAAKQGLTAPVGEVG